MAAALLLCCSCLVLIHSHEAALKMGICLGSPEKQGISKVPSFPFLPFPWQPGQHREAEAGRELSVPGDAAESLQRCWSCSHPHWEPGRDQEGKGPQPFPAEKHSTLPRKTRELVTDDVSQETSGESFLRECHLGEHPITHIKGVSAESH